MTETSYMAIALSAYDADSSSLLSQLMMVGIVSDPVSANDPKNSLLLLRHMVLVKINWLQVAFSAYNRSLRKWKELI